MSTSEAAGGSKRWLLFGAIALGVGIAIYVIAGEIAKARDSARAPREETLPLVETVSATKVESLTVVEEGFLRPRAVIDVVPEISGKVVEVSPKLEPGGSFEAGELMFRIDPRTFEADLQRAVADLAAAEAELARSEAEATRQRRLAEIGATADARRQQSDAALASAKARIGQTRAALTLARKRLDDTQISAPFDASVISETVALGRFVQPGAAAARIYDTGAAEIIVGLRPSDADSVRRAARSMGDSLKVQITPGRASASTATLTGNLKRFGTAVDERSRTVPVVIEVPDAFSSDNRASVFANDYVTVEIPAESEGLLFSAPLGSVRRESFVWILGDEDRLAKVDVTPLKRSDVDVIFRTSTDLSAERIVLTALTEEAEGIRVEVIAEQDESGA